MNLSGIHKKKKIYYAYTLLNDSSHEEEAIFSARVAVKALHTLNLLGKYRVSFFVDGFTDNLLKAFRSTIRNMGVRFEIIRPLRDENDQFIRAVDAICGFARKALFPIHDNDNYWLPVLQELERIKTIIKL